MAASALEALINLCSCKRRARDLPAASLTKDVSQQKQVHDHADLSTTDVADDAGSNYSGDSTDDHQDASATGTGSEGAPGLTLPTGGAHPWSHGAAQTNWNAHALPFIPSDHAPYPADMGFSAPTQPQQQPPDNLMALKEALDRLAPGEIATVKSMLEGKIRDKPPEQQPLVMNCSPLSRRRRPFDPYQGERGFAHGQNPIDTRNNKSFFPKPQVQSQRARRAEPEEAGNSLATFLRDLTSVPDARVLTLRKINRLGLNSATPLETYFSKFGTVEKIMVSHTKGKARYSEGKVRIRPAVLGFAVMSKVEEAQAALAHGAAHVVEGVEIEVTTFQSHSIDAAE